MTVGFGSNSILSDICTTGDLAYQRGYGCQTQCLPQTIGGRIGIFPTPNRYFGGCCDCMDEAEFNPIKMRAEQLAVKEAVSDLQDSILEDDAEKVIENWNEFKEAFKNTAEYRMLAAGSKDGEVDERQVNALMAQRFEMLTGQNIKKLIKENCDGNFMAGFKDMFWRGHKSSDQLIDEMFKVKQPYGSGFKRFCGGAVPAVAVGAAIGAWGGPLGAAIGAGIGLIVAGINRLFC